MEDVWRGCVGAVIALALGLGTACGDGDEAQPVSVTEEPPEVVADEADEAAGDEAPPEAPAAAVVAARIEASPVPDALVARLDAALTEAAGTETRIREARLVREEGADTVYAFYELSALQRCVAEAVEGGTARRAAVRECRSDMEYRTAEGRRFEECAEMRLARAQVGPPPEGGDDAARAITVTADEEVIAACVVDRVTRFALADVDADGHAEIELAWADHGASPGMRSQLAMEYRAHAWHLVEARTLAERFTMNHVLPSEPGEDSDAARAHFRDEDGDGHDDVVVERIAYDVRGGPDDCDFDPETGWPRAAAEPTEAAPEPACAIRERTETLWRYDPESDRYRVQREG